MCEYALENVDLSQQDLVHKEAQRMVEIRAEATVELVAHLHVTTIVSVTLLEFSRRGRGTFVWTSFSAPSLCFHCRTMEGQSGLDKLLNVAAFGSAEQG